jgi:hypothetical protein
VSRPDCLCTYAPFGDTSVLLTREGCPAHDPDAQEDRDE